MSISLDTIYNEECSEGMKRIPDEFVDLTVTSPPYDNLRTYNGFTFDYKPVIRELYRVTKRGGVVVWIVADGTINGSESGTSFREALFAMDCGFRLHDTMIWSKGVFSQMGDLTVRYPQTFEYMFVFSKGTPKTFNPIKDRKNLNAGKTIHGHIRNADGSYKDTSTKGNVIDEWGVRFNVWNCNTAYGRYSDHPAAFPEPLVRDHIISWSNPGDIVLDPFVGSGTTAKCAIALQRRYIGFEISKEYFDMANRRLNGVQQYGFGLI